MRQNQRPAAMPTTYQHLSGKISCFAFLIVLFSLFPTEAFAQPSRPQLESKNRVNIRAREYDGLMAADHVASLKKWETDFLSKRADAIGLAGRELADIAIEMRNKRKLSWREVEQSREYRAVYIHAVQEAIDRERLEEDLDLWAKRVERDTRELLISFSKYVIADDIGSIFEEGELKNIVVKRVREIDTRALVAGVAYQELTSSVLRRLPSDTITPRKKKFINNSLKALTIVTASIFSGYPSLSTVVKLTDVFLRDLVVDYLSQKINAMTSSVPDPEDLAHHVEHSLRRWNREFLSPRLSDILEDYREEVLAATKTKLLAISIKTS